MQIVGASLFWLFAAICFVTAKKVYGKKTVDYSQYRLASGTVIGTHDFHGQCWMVKFRDSNGREVIGADEYFARNTFHPQKYTLPKRGELEWFYYWPMEKPDRFKINDIPVAYYIHFCNETLYELHHIYCSKNKNRLYTIGVITALMGFAILIFGKF